MKMSAFVQFRETRSFNSGRCRWRWTRSDDSGNSTGVVTGRHVGRMLGWSVLDTYASATRCPQFREAAESTLLILLIVKRTNKKHEEESCTHTQRRGKTKTKTKTKTKNESGNFLAMIKTKLKGERNKIYLKKKKKRKEVNRVRSTEQRKGASDGTCVCVYTSLRWH